MRTSFKSDAAGERFAKRREQAILVAAAVFAERGYLGASTQEIALRLGIRQGSLYHYFSSKEEALEEVCLLAAAGGLQQLEEICSADTTTAEKLRAVVKRQLYGLQTGCHALIVFSEQRHHLGPDRRERVREPSRRYRQLLAQMLADGIARGELRDDLDATLTARALLALCHAAAARYAQRPDIDLDQVAEHHAELVLHGACRRLPAPLRTLPRNRR